MLKVSVRIKNPEQKKSKNNIAILIVKRIITTILIMHESISCIHPHYIVDPFLVIHSFIHSSPSIFIIQPIFSSSFIQSTLSLINHGTLF